MEKLYPILWCFSFPYAKNLEDNLRNKDEPKNDDEILNLLKILDY